MKDTHIKTSLPMEDRYPKLVRDKIPEIVKKETGKEVETRIIEKDKEYLKYLLRKVIEEASELERAENKDHRAEEIADILELIDTILWIDGLDRDMIRKVQIMKNEERGGFRKKILMLKSVKEAEEK